MKNLFEFLYGFKSYFTSINKHLSKLEGCIHSITKNNIKAFTPFGNELLPLSNNFLDIFPYYISIETEGYL